MKTQGRKPDPFLLLDQVMARARKNKQDELTNKQEEQRLKRLNQRADEITFEILADTVAQEIALMLKNTISRDTKGKKR